MTALLLLAWTSCRRWAVDAGRSLPMLAIPPLLPSLLDFSKPRDILMDACIWRLGAVVVGGASSLAIARCICLPYEAVHTASMRHPAHGLARLS